MTLNKEQVKQLLVTELQGNLKILIDPKKKDSFSDARVSTWTNTVTGRIMYHLFEENKK